MGKVKDVLKALPDGHILTTVDLNDIGAPKIIDQRPIAVNPWTVGISPDGKTLAIDTRQKDANLLLIDLVDNVPGAVTTVFSANLIRKFQLFRSAPV